jgi:hypothetical protein
MDELNPKIAVLVTSRASARWQEAQAADRDIAGRAHQEPAPRHPRTG